MKRLLKEMLDDLEDKALQIKQYPWPLNCSVEVSVDFALKLVELSRKEKNHE